MKELFKEISGLILRTLLFLLPFALLAELYHLLF